MGNNLQLETDKEIYAFTPFLIVVGTFPSSSVRLLTPVFSIAYKEVHDAEILTIDYSAHSSAVPNPDDVAPQNADVLLATASRDRLVHVFNASKV